MHLIHTLLEESVGIVLQPLCNLCVLCVSVVNIPEKSTHHRDTENTEGHREVLILDQRHYSDRLLKEGVNEKSTYNSLAH